MNEMVIKNGRVIDPGRINGIRDILICCGKIEQIREPGRLNLIDPAIQTLDATDLIVTPGLIDMHVHFREPGGEHKETVKTGCKAAAAGGFTSVCTMPNTTPVNDNAGVTEFVLHKAEQVDKIHVYPVGAISLGLKGRALSDFNELKNAGVISVSDDGCPVMNRELMRKALETADHLGLTVISHSEDLTLTGEGVMNEGLVARKLGFDGIPNSSESLMVERDIALAQLTGTQVHIAHVSTKESVHAIRVAKEQGVRVTAETAPHYFTLTDKAVEAYGTHAKMNPPLRSEEDRIAIRKGLADGTIDVIATDHAPHAPQEKKMEFKNAPNGIIGLETSVPISFGLVEDGVLTLPELIDKMSGNPARILGFDHGLKNGSTADLTIIDPEKEYTIHASGFSSLSVNTPFDGWDVRGMVMYTIVNGRIIYQCER